jgi:hypothetical protein
MPEKTPVSALLDGGQLADVHGPKKGQTWCFFRFLQVGEGTSRRRLAVCECTHPLARFVAFVWSRPLQQHTPSHCLAVRGEGSGPSP